MNSLERFLVSLTRFRQFLSFALFAFLAVSVSYAADYTWTGHVSSRSNNWGAGFITGTTQGSNWDLNGSNSGVLTPVGSDDVFFDTTANSSRLTIGFSSDHAANSLTFNRSESFTLGSAGNPGNHTLELDGATLSVLLGSHTIHTNVEQPQFGTWSIATSLEVNGDLEGSGILVKFGNGTLTLNGSDSSLAEISVVTGRVESSMSHDGALFVGANGTIAPGGDTVGTFSAGENSVIEGVYACDLEGINSDHIDVAGTLDVSEGTLDINELGILSAGRYRIAYADAIVGEFATVNGLRQGLSIEYLSDSIDIVRIGTYHVDADSTATNPDGASWSTAFPKLADAISAAVAGNEIWVADGVYYPDESGNSNTNSRLATFQMKSGVSIYGGFSGSETTLSQRDFFNNVTILSGDLQQNDTDVDGDEIPDDPQSSVVGNNAFNVVTGTGADSTSLLDGFTITAGYATVGNDFRSRGGGINCEDTDGVFDNVATTSPIIKNCRIVGNRGSSRGGGTTVERGAEAYFENCVFSNNVAATLTTGSGSGGGLYISGLAEFVNCLISGNYSGTRGGGASISDTGDATFTNCTVSGNQCSNPGLGGGIQTSSGGIRLLQNTIIWKNWEGSILRDNSGTNPRFVDEIAARSQIPSLEGDFRLSLASGLINTGTNALNTTTADLSGLARFVGTIDPGPYENDGQAPTIIAPDDFTLPCVEYNESDLGNPIVMDNSSNYVVTNDAPEIFPSGVVTTVTWTVIDASGNIATDTQEVQAQLDTTDPVIVSFPENLLLECTSPSGETDVDLGTLVASDNCNVGLAISNDAPSSFGLGSTDVTWRVEDSSGNFVTRVQTITVQDTTDPVFVTFPDDIAIECTNHNGETVALGTATASDSCDSSPTISNDAPNVFALGITHVVWRVEDASGNFVERTQTVTVQDTADPSFVDFPEDLIVECISHNGQAVDLGEATGADLCDPELTITNDAPSLFTLGTTTVTWRVEDDSGNFVTGEQSVTLRDTTDPFFVDFPDDIFIECEGPGSIPASAVPLPRPEVGDLCDPNPTIRRTSFWANYIVEYSHNIDWIVEDASGNSITGRYHVRIVDTTPPVFTYVPGDTVLDCKTRSGQLERPTATDICDENVSITHDAPSILPPGDTLVTWTATDDYGNSVEATQLITVPADVTAPEFSLVGPDYYQWPIGVDYEELGVDILDDCDLDPLVEIEGTVDVNTPGSYVITYSAMDASGNVTSYELERTIEIVGLHPIVYVDASRPDGGDGSSWENAFNKLNDALRFVVGNSGQQVWIAGGVYYPDEGAIVEDGDLAATFELREGIGYYGGFAGDETSLDQRDKAANPTVLSGDIDQDDDNSNSDGNYITESYDEIVGDNANNVVLGENLFNPPLLDGLIITGGYAYGNSRYIEDNRGSTYDGGGLFLIQSRLPSLIDCSFQGNFAGLAGGGIVYIANDETLDQPFGSFSATWENCEFSGNRDRGQGGGGVVIWAFGEEVIDLEMINCRFEGNFGDNGAGLHWAADLSVNAANCLFAGNLSHQAPGILAFNNERPSYFNNCTFAGNSGLIGSNRGPNLIDGEVHYTNCLFWNNITLSGGFPYGTQIYNHSLVEGVDLTSEGIGNFAGSIDPLFVDPLVADSMGDDDPKPALGGDYRLQGSSPVIDAGDNSAGLLELDLDGFARIEGGTVDLGAYEAGALNVYVAESFVETSNGSGVSGTVDFGDIVTWNAGQTNEVTGLVFGSQAFYGLIEAVDRVRDSGQISIDSGLWEEGERIEIEKGVTLLGEGAMNTIISGSDSHGIFNIFAEGQEIAFERIGLTNGYASFGGGIRCSGDLRLNLIECEISNCYAGLAGAGIFGSGELNIFDSTIQGNQAGAEGGGIVAGTGTSLFIFNSTVSKNMAALQFGGSGGAMALAGEVTIINATIIENYADFKTGGLLIRSSANVSIGNTVIAGNEAPSEMDVRGDFTSLGGNFIGDTSDSTGFDSSLGDLTFVAGETIDSLLDTVLHNNGGQTMTHGLVPGSRLIGVGRVSILPFDVSDRDGDSNTSEFYPFDQRGFDRQVSGLVSIGAVEGITTSPYFQWVFSYLPGETDASVIGRDADANGDGETNNDHFALDTNPIGAGGLNGKFFHGVVEDEGEEYFTITLPVRNGAVFYGMNPAETSIDGVTYLILGGSGVETYDLEVIEREVASDGLPALGSFDGIAGTDWEYRSFRLTVPISENPSGFITVFVNYDNEWFGSF
ncbi:DUF5011 domain-containing protein [Puniceicoccaceae bacterium K14]|nr:DUF5011 domain-containing protein [Puniceicoccaceae bacterium K14]